MSISEEISKLAELREKGVLSEDEFEQAKKKVLAGGQGLQNPPPDRATQRYEFEDRSDASFGKAANRYVTFQMIMAVIGIILFLLFAGPIMCSSNSPFKRNPGINFPSSFPR